MVRMGHLYQSTYIGTGTRRDPFRPRGAEGTWSAIDLRPDASRADGSCLLLLEEPSSDTSLILLGHDKDERPARATLARDSALASEIAPATLGEFIGWTVMRAVPVRSSLADPDTGLHRQMSVVLGGEAWWTQPVITGGATYSDDFNRANAFPLDGQWGLHVVSPRSADLVSNQCNAGAAVNDDRLYYSTGVTPGNDQFAEIDIPALVGDTDVGPVCRLDTGIYSWYGLSMWTPGPVLFKWVTGAFSNITSLSGTVTAGTRYRLEVTGSNLTAKANGSTIGGVTDTSLPSGLVGFFMYTGACVLDNWAGGDLSAAGDGNLHLRRTGRTIMGIQGVRIR
jgi:hypothetical protein